MLNVTLLPAPKSFEIRNDLREFVGSVSVGDMANGVGVVLYSSDKIKFRTDLDVKDVKQLKEFLEQVIIILSEKNDV